MTEPLIVCIPVEVSPDGPEAPGSIYEKVTCPVCKKAMWLGTRSKKYMDQGVPAICGICAVISGQLRRDNIEEMTKLSDFDDEGKSA